MKKLVKKFMSMPNEAKANLLDCTGLLGIMAVLAFVVFAEESVVANYMLGFFGFLLSCGSVIMVREAKNCKEGTVPRMMIRSAFSITAYAPLMCILENWLKKFDLTVMPFAGWILGSLMIWFIFSLAAFIFITAAEAFAKRRTCC